MYKDKVDKIQRKDIEDSGLNTPDDSSEDDIVEEVQIFKKDIKKQRQSVSAEVFGQFNKKENFVPKVVSKPQELQQRIKDKLNQAFMFNSLTDKEKEIVMLAMEEKKFKKGDWVIKQGEEGNDLYVIDQGQLDCYKLYSGESQPQKLKVYQPGESFGELALLYNTKRAASIQAISDSVLFSLDRSTFNHIVRDASIRKREKYEQVLTQWSIFKSISDPYEKTKIADIIEEVQPQNGQILLKQGTYESDIYLVLEGEVEAQDKNGQTQFTYKANDYFGEISVVLNKPQPFNFVVKGSNTVLVVIAKRSYDSTLKIVENVLIQNAQKYKQFL
ncbi:Cyclic nucleotide-binding protein [Pseudocohnilembus persalinus]|uniref:cAMP-dependent protein kinase regulatory subunit n=1 Tax=Pseudocohnilembus persalinus TaxID=266149 RepID=A0A0V0R8Y6_PSEPJ|nr:Cyclic nucleotide-binding protein [Pseudocohnilembus persalinus]|eukprot:KRX10955.1 Cyclic nucleotide-binding protein [Pseudocohnilembus persalinus]